MSVSDVRAARTPTACGGKARPLENHDCVSKSWRCSLQKREVEREVFFFLSFFGAIQKKKSLPGKNREGKKREREKGRVEVRLRAPRYCRACAHVSAFALCVAPWECARAQKAEWGSKRLEILVLYLYEKDVFFSFLFLNFRVRVRSTFFKNPGTWADN